MTTPSAAMEECIRHCLACYSTCLGMALNHCLEQGGRHAEPAHLRLMMACAEMCRASAHVMVIGTPVHTHTCRACAELCDRCASDCERVGDMDACVTACRTCAASCRSMAASGGA